MKASDVMTTNKQTILCVDDDPGTHKLLQAELKSNGFISHHAMSGEQAIKFLVKKHVDLVILDLNMPGMNGFTTLSHLKEMAVTKHIPVIFLSTYDQEELKVKGFEHGADDYIVKPFTGPMLLARMNAVLRRSIKPDISQDVIRGQVKDLSIFNLLQMLTFSDKHCTVVFPEMEGELLVDSGRILFIRQAEFVGIDALVRLVLINQGTFSVRNDLPDNDPGIERIPIDSLVLSTVVRVDDIKAKFHRSIPTSLLALDAGSEEFPDIRNLAEYFPLSAQELSARMPGAVTNNVEQIRKAFVARVLIAMA